MHSAIYRRNCQTVLQNLVAGNDEMVERGCAFDVQLYFGGHRPQGEHRVVGGGLDILRGWHDRRHHHRIRGGQVRVTTKQNETTLSYYKNNTNFIKLCVTSSLMTSINDIII